MKRMSEARTGQSVSEKTKEKISQTLKEKYKSGERKSALKGKKASKETRKKMRENNGRYWLGKKREMSESWREKMRRGIQSAWDKKEKKEYKRAFHNRDAKYLEWRMAVFERNSFTCQFCSARGCYVEAHHIKSWADYKQLRYEVKNGVTLCKECHRLAHKKH